MLISRFGTSSRGCFAAFLSAVSDFCAVAFPLAQSDDLFLPEKVAYQYNVLGAGAANNRQSLGVP